MGGIVVPLLKPGTVEAAKVYIGTTLKKWWEATETSEAGWYKARILAAYDDIVNEVTGELEEGLQLTLSYDDGDEEDVWWEDVFGRAAKVTDLQLPEAAVANQKKLQQELLAKERPPLKSCNTRNMTPIGNGKRPACHLSGRSAKRRAPLDDTALKARVEGVRGSAQEEAEDATPLMQQPRWAGRRSRRNSPAETPEPEEELAELMEADDEDQSPANREREASPAAAEADAEDEEADKESPEPAARVGRRRSRSRQPAEAAAAAQLPASQALTQRGGARPTQRTLSQIPRMNFPKMEPGNGVGIAGQVKSVHAENFMSHQNFECEFGPHLNFITGENGSGKSATLQCLQVCLGARARDTGRSSAAKDLINYSATTAVAKTVLWNTGSDAYQYELYGPTITITRKITSSGGSFYSLGAHGGRATRQVTKSEVDAIIQDHFNIDASNPIICLTQDHARSFAGSATDEDKYKLYMAATGFDAVLRGLAASEAQVVQWRDRLKAVQEQLTEKDARIQEIRRTIQEMQEIEAWQAEVEHLSKCIAWVGALNMRGTAQHCRVQVEEDLPRHIAEATAGVQEKEADAKAAKADYDAKKAENERVAAEMQDIQAEQKRLGNETKAKERAHRQATQAVQQARNALENKTAELDGAQSTEEDLLQQHMQSTQAEAAEAARELREREQAAEAASAAASCASQALREAEALKALAEKDLHERQRETRYHDGRVKEMQKELKSLRSSKGDPVAIFGGNEMLRLVQAIDAAVRQGKFQKRPIGPIGAHLSLSDERWSFAVDAAIGGCFGSFLVHSHRDLQELIDMSRRLRMQWPVITVYNFDLPAHDQSRRQQLPPDVLTIQQVLCLPEDPSIAKVLRNYLLDNESIERRVLVPDKDSGMHMLRATDFFGRAEGRGALANDVWAENAWRGYVRGQTQTSMDFRGTRRARLSKDVQGQTAELERELAAAREALKAAQQGVAQAKREDTEAKQNVERLRKERGMADRQRASTQSQLEDLRASVQEAAAAEEPDLDNAEEIERLQEEIRELQRTLDEKSAEQAEAATKAADAKKAKEEQAAANKAQMAQTKAAYEAFQAASTSLQDARDALVDTNGRLQKLQGMQEDAQRKLQDVIKGVEELTAIAERACTEEEAADARRLLKELWRANKRATSEERAEAFLTMDEMDTRMISLKRDITRRERDMGTNLEALKVEEERLSRWHAAKLADYRKSVSAYRAFKEAYGKRQRKHEEVRDHVSKELNSQFNRYLKSRKWRGAIKIDQERATLTIFAQQDSQSGRPESDLKTLSGGERSFVTVCYLLALCKKLQGCFHALDEFDVFMDNVNRGRSLMMLMEYAVSHKDTQLILLTPLNLGAINDAAKRTQAMQPNGEWPAPDFMRIRQMFPAKRAVMRSQAGA